MTSAARGARRAALPALALLLAGALLAALAAARPGDAGGAVLPDFAVPDLHDAARVLSAEELGPEPFLLNVWATWCVPCRREHGQLMRIAALGEVAIIGLSWRDRRADALRWLDFLGDPYARVGSDADGAVAERLGVRAAPETLLVAGDGRILLRHAGPLDEHTWREVVRPALRRAARRR